MKNHEGQPNGYNSFRDRPVHHIDPAFEDNLTAFVRFWRNIGRPDKDTLYILLIWDDKEHDRQATADTLGLHSRENIRKLIARLAKTYQENTSPEPPSVNR